MSNQSKSSPNSNKSTNGVPTGESIEDVDTCPSSENCSPEENSP